MDAATFVEQSDLLTREQAAKYAACSLSKLDNLRKSGQLSAIRNGRRVYFHRTDLEALFTSEALSEEERERALARKIAATAPALSPERRLRLATLLS